MDWVAESFQDKKELLFAKKNNIKDFANKIEMLLTDKNLYDSIQNNMYKYACENWSTRSIKQSLEQLYKEIS